MDLRNYFKELKRRNVFKAAIAYLVVSWIVIQVISILFPLFKIPGAFQKGIVIVLAVGFPLWLIFAWIYELTPEGLKKTEKVEQEKSITHETSNKFNKLIIGALGVAIILLGANLYSNYSGNAEKPATPRATAKDSISTANKTNEKSIAVLAFEDMSPQNDQEYFSDGISEEILNYLAKIPDLKVISRTSSFSYKGSNKDIKTIAQELGVAYVLEGSVRKAGDEVRITTQLIHADDRAHVWSETYDRELKDIFKIQDDIAEEVTNNLQTSILKEPVKTTNTKAYTLYLQAKHLSDIQTEEATKNSITLLKKAITIDSTYAPAWQLIAADYYFLGFNIVSMSQEKANKLGREAAKKSVAIDPDYALGYLQIAFFNMINFNFEKAKQNAEKALELDPKNAMILAQVPRLSFASLSEMIQNTKHSIELDPLKYANYNNLGLYYYMAGENKKALTYFNQYQEYQPGAAGVSCVKTVILLELGEKNAAKKEIEKELNPAWKAYGKTKVLFQLGQKEEAQKILDEFINSYPTEAANIADIYAFMGNREKTFEWLEKAVEVKDPTMTEAVYYPTFKKFHDDPRWQQLLEDMGVPEDNGIPGYHK